MYLFVLSNSYFSLIIIDYFSLRDSATMLELQDIVLKLGFKVTLIELFVFVDSNGTTIVAELILFY